jgi:hypothetical protein
MPPNVPAWRGYWPPETTRRLRSRGRGRCARSPGPCATAGPGRFRKGPPAGWSARGARPQPRRAVGRPGPAGAHRADCRGLQSARRAGQHPGRPAPGTPGHSPRRPLRRRRDHLCGRAPGKPQLMGHRPGGGDDRYQLPRSPSQKSDLGELDPCDDDGFARVLGQWTPASTLLAWRPSRTSPKPGVPQGLKRPAPRPRTTGQGSRQPRHEAHAGARYTAGASRAAPHHSETSRPPRRPASLACSGRGAHGGAAPRSWMTWRGTFARAGRGSRKQQMGTGTGYYGHVSITAGTVRGRALVDPVLEIELEIQADGC